LVCASSVAPRASNPGCCCTFSMGWIRCRHNDAFLPGPTLGGGLACLAWAVVTRVTWWCQPRQVRLQQQVNETTLACPRCRSAPRPHGTSVRVTHVTVLGGEFFVGTAISRDRKVEDPHL
jgi:hypothetical protein